MIDNTQNPVNAVPVGVVDQQSPIVNPNVSAELVNPQTMGMQQPDVNAAFAQLRREKEALQAQTDLANQLIAKVHGQDGINNVQDFQNAVLMAEQQAQAEQMQVNPALIQKLTMLEDKIQNMEQEKQTSERDRTIQQMKTQMQEVLAKAQAEGMNVTEDQLLNAAQEKNMNNFHDVYKLIKPETNSEEYKNKIIADYINGLKTGQIPVEGGGNTPSTVVSTPKSWQDAKNGAMAMLRGKIK